MEILLRRDCRGHLIEKNLHLLDGLDHIFVIGRGRDYLLLGIASVGGFDQSPLLGETPLAQDRRPLDDVGRGACRGRLLFLQRHPRRSHGHPRAATACRHALSLGKLLLLHLEPHIAVRLLLADNVLGPHLGLGAQGVADTALHCRALLRRRPLAGKVTL